MPVMTPNRKITNIVKQTDIKGQRDWKSEYKQMLDNNSPAEDYDKLLSDFLIANNINEDKIDKFKDVFWTELTSSDGDGFININNPFIDFVQIMQNKWYQDIDRNKYGTIHNLYVDNILTNEDLEGKSELRQDHIIFNPSLYRRPATEINDIVTLYDDLLDGYKLRNIVKDTKLEKLVKDRKSELHLLKKIFYSGNEVKSWGEINQLVNKISKSEYKHASRLQSNDKVQPRKATMSLKNFSDINRRQFDANENVQNILKQLRSTDAGLRQRTLADLVTYLNTMIK